MQTKEEHNRKIKELYDKRKVEGICTKCGKEKADNGSSLCFSCKIKKNNKGRERYATRKTKNLCVFCNAEKPDDGHVLCADCREKRKEQMANNEIAKENQKAYSRELYAWRKENGICVECGKNDAWYNHLCCPECIEKQNNRSAKSRANITEERKQEYNEQQRNSRKSLRRYREDNNLCITCGKPRTVGNYCLECNIKRLKRNEQQRIKRRIQNTYKVNKKQFKIMNGLCVRCGNPIEGNHGTWCNACADKQAEVFRVHKSAYWVRENELLFMATAKRRFVYGT